MKTRSAILAVSAIAIAAALLGCAGKEKPPARADAVLSPAELVAASQDAAERSIKAQNRKRARGLATSGIEYAERCIAAAPSEPGCYYWRAINTGLYHKAHVTGYQRGVKRMIGDCNKVIELDECYDHAGAYRILGQIYTKLPQTGAHAESITRDLALAEKYLRQAVRLAPDYPENYVLLAETLLDEDKVAEGVEALDNARDLAPHWKHDISYDDWHSTMIALKKRAAKASKR